MNRPITIRASATIEAGSAAGPRRFKVDAYFGGALMLGGYQLPVVVDLAGMVADDNVIANLDHKDDQRVGHVDEVKNDGRQLRLAGIVSAATAAASEFIASAEQSFPWAASIEAMPRNIEEIPRGSTGSANGRTFQGPILITRQSRLTGIAFLSKGADSNARAMLAGKRNHQMRTKNLEFTNWMESNGIDAAEMTGEQLAGIHANYHGRDKITAADRSAVAPLIVAGGDSVDSETQRLEQIERATRGSWGDYSERVNTIKAAAIGAELSVDELVDGMRRIRRERLEANVPMATTIYSPRQRGTDGLVIEAAICLSGNLPNIEKFYSEQVLDAAHKLGEPTYAQIFAAAAPGILGPGERLTAKLDEIMHAAFGHPSIRATGFSTINLPATLSNTANKFMGAGFASVDQTLLKICAVRSVTNFKEITTVSLLGGGMEFKDVGPDGELKHGSLDELTYGNKAGTRGIIYSITRTDLINDDLSLLTTVPKKIGRGGMLKLNNLGWAEFLDNGSFFTGGNGNAVARVLDLDGLDYAESQYLQIVDPDGEPLGILPAILLAPPNSRGAALALMSSQSVVGGNSTVPSNNPMQNRFRVESSPYMAMNRFTGYSAAAWYLLADPNQLPAIEIAALNGRIEPVVETAVADFSVLGIEMRGFSDVGIRKQEFRAGMRSTGVDA